MCTCECGKAIKKREACHALVQVGVGRGRKEELLAGPRSSKSRGVALHASSQAHMGTALAKEGASQGIPACRRPSLQGAR